MDKKAFFAFLRRADSGVFGKSLSADQVKGVEAIVDEAIRRGTPLSHLAYMLATAYHETGRKMSPNVENLNYTTVARIRQVWPSRFPTNASAQPYVKNPRGLANKVYNGRMGNRIGSDDGWNFRGRGLPHLTGRDNYVKASQVTGVDLVTRPEQATELTLAVKIIFDGMTRGWYTGAKMATFLDKAKPDYVNARKIVNGLDKAKDIAGYASSFEKALTTAGYKAVKPAPVNPAPTQKAPEPVEAPEPTSASPATKTLAAGIIAAIAGGVTWLMGVPCAYFNILCGG